jgi:hypothetical protein
LKRILENGPASLDATMSVQQEFYKRRSKTLGIAFGDEPAPSIRTDKAQPVKQPRCDL